MDALELNETTYTLAKEYDFRYLTAPHIGAAFETRLIWDREQIINDEEQYYLDPEAWREYSPFQYHVNTQATDNRTYLAITASPTPDELRNVAISLDYAGRKKLRRRSSSDPQLTNTELEAIISEHGKRQHFISGIMTTRGGDQAFSQLFGYFEISARVPDAQGAWPAFWLLPTHESWPEGIDILSEIDAAEWVKQTKSGTYHSTIHSNETGKLVSSKANEINTGVDLTADFHRYGLSWDADFIVAFFDGKEVKRRPTPADMQTVPRHALLNLALGGDWAGDASAADYPASFDIEYLRIYKSVPVPPRMTDGDVELMKRGDVVWVLKDGRPVTMDMVNRVTEYLIELNATTTPIQTDTNS